MNEKIVNSCGSCSGVCVEGELLFGRWWCCVELLELKYTTARVLSWCLVAVG